MDILEESEVRQPVRFGRARVQLQACNGAYNIGVHIRVLHYAYNSTTRCHLLAVLLQSSATYRAAD